ncbi:DUF262 domain-containing protein [Pseudoclavibacter chungangensis]|uniref:DUF262 domain-containing protein n=1 Tax=Pseudoclavibacter chungangensis TaxID=587635 RepID=A0A7J5BM95_9MICO|nr:DUF262 domain-containing protein [Pseudoclavibacter chungangensis]KAB1651691.1 DUF262 domain-containing protein [Pseudoclavibacter chungangensis]NYJ66928.1 sulfur relay (sulfurtransferase) DsrC/TusE family protein [Pseudoclavibacter chungangensis]
MQDGGQLDISLRGVAHLLRDQSLEVPAFQRNYSWSREQVDEYWFDLKAALTTDQPFYFLGTVVLGRSASGAASVIDGQQRLATTSMLLAAIRDVFRDRGDVRRAETLQSLYLAAPSLLENRTQPKLQLNAVDQAFFEAHILRLRDTPAQDAETRPALADAFARLSARLVDDVEGVGPKWEDRLLRWVELLEKRTQVIAVSVTDDSDAFVIFETLNDRGMELSVSDLIKNYLLGLSREEIALAQELWVSTSRAIEETATSKEITSFIRQWWSSRQGATRERDLYKSLRSNVSARDEAVSVLREMAKSAPAYAALLDPDHYLWAELPAMAPRSVAVLLELGFEQYRPLAIAAMRKFPGTDLGELLASIVNWSVRGLIVGGIGGGSAERYYAEAAVRVSNERARTVEEVFRELDGMVASDREFEATFRERRVLRISYLRYLLRSLDSGEAISTLRHGDSVPIGFFPRTDPNGVWGDFVAEDDRKQLSARIGNYGLFPAHLSAKVPSAPLERLAFFEAHDELRSSLGLTWDQVTPDVVASRQAQMAEAAVTVWPTIQKNTV